MKHTTPRKTSPRETTLTARARKAGGKIFISYRRDDAAPYARHLFDSLVARFGEEKVFLDQSTIEPGAAFPRLIRDTIADSSVMLVVIGPRWTGASDRFGRARIKEARDWVRLETELALRAKLHIIPLLVDGAAMPKAAELPPSLKRVTTLQARSLPWHETVGELAKTISKLTESGGRYDLTHHLSERTAAEIERPIVLTAMEVSLAHQGERVVLDDVDLKKKFMKATRRELKDGVQMNEIMYVIDRVGIQGRTARGSRRTYTARAIRLQSLSQIPAELAKGRPVIAGLQVTQAWFGKKVSRTGLIELWRKPGFTQGGLLAALVGFEPADGSVRFLTWWPTWGDRGIGTITADALRRSALDPREMFSVEAAEAVSLP
jgi:hypothetical protein